MRKICFHKLYWPAKANFIVLIISLAIYSCSPIDNLNEVKKYYIGIDDSGIILNPDNTFRYSKTYPPDTSYGTWFIESNKIIILNSKYSLDSLPVIVEETKDIYSPNNYHISIFNLNGEIIELHQKQFIIILNGFDTIRNIDTNEFIIEKEYENLTSIKLGIEITSPPYRIPPPVTDMLMYNDCVISDEASNHFKFYLFYENYLWDFIEFINVTVKVKKNKLIFGNRIVYYNMELMPSRSVSLQP